MSQSNGWGPISAGPNQSLRKPKGYWRPLCRELAMRLENTPPGESLFVPFETVEEAKHGRHSVRAFFLREIGAGGVRTAILEEDEGAQLEIARGPNWMVIIDD